MNWSVVLVFGIFLTILSSYEISSFVHHRVKRVVGGESGSIKNSPYLAALLHRSVVRCGAAIYDTKTIITAAHCLQDVILKKLKVRVGSNFGEQNGTVFEVEDYVFHPNYSRLIQHHDLGVVWLKSPLVYNETVQPIELPASNEDLPYGAEGKVTGWGRTSEKGPFADNFQYFKAPILQREKCIKSGGGGYDSYRITDTMFCAGYLEGGRDSCKSDSGGPFVIEKKLVGVVSFGQGCARPKYPGIYANVASMRLWIDEVIADKNSGKQFNEN